MIYKWNEKNTFSIARYISSRGLIDEIRYRGLSWVILDGIFAHLALYNGDVSNKTSRGYKYVETAYYSWHKMDDCTEIEGRGKTFGIARMGNLISSSCYLVSGKIVVDNVRKDLIVLSEEELK